MNKLYLGEDLIFDPNQFLKVKDLSEDFYTKEEIEDKFQSKEDPLITETLPEIEESVEVIETKVDTIENILYSEPEVSTTPNNRLDKVIGEVKELRDDTELSKKVNLSIGTNVDFNPEKDFVIEDYKGEIRVYKDWDWGGSTFNCYYIEAIADSDLMADDRCLINRVICLGDTSNLNTTDMMEGGTLRPSVFPYEGKITPSFDRWNAFASCNFTNMTSFMDVSQVGGRQTFYCATVYPGTYNFDNADTGYYCCWNAHIVDNRTRNNPTVFNFPLATDLFGLFTNASIDNINNIRVNAPSALYAKGALAAQFAVAPRVLEVSDILKAPKLQSAENMLTNVGGIERIQFRNFPNLTNVTRVAYNADVRILWCVLPEVTVASCLALDSLVEWIQVDFPKCVTCDAIFNTPVLRRAIGTLGAVSNATNMFNGKAEHIEITFAQCPTNLTNMFSADLPHLKILKLKGVGCNLNLSNLSTLNEEMLKFMIDNSWEGKKFTITVNDEFFNDFLVGSDLLAVASAKGITIAGAASTLNNYGDSYVTKTQLKKALPIWNGTEEEFDQITNKDNNTLYIVK